jgi:Serpin (serine protease inhibitor)
VVTSPPEAVRCANELTARWADRVATGRSVALSGSAVWPLLAYLAAAADGPGRAELVAAVGLAGDAALAATALLSDLGSAPAVRTAIGVWLHRNVELAGWWRANVPLQDSSRLAGDPRLDQAALDAWVAQRTGGLVERIPSAVNEETRMLLAAVLTVRTRWREPFAPGLLIPVAGPWKGRRLACCRRATADRDQVRVLDTAAGPVTVLAVDGHDDICVDLAIGTDDAPPAAVLRTAIDAPSAACPATPGSELGEATAAPGVMAGIASLDPEPRLYSWVPRFTVRADHDLLGHGDVFGLLRVTDSSRGHFPRLSRFPLAVGAARQGIEVAFTEQGFVAAAATVFDLPAGGVPPRRPRSIGVSFDRPFAFAARLRSSGLVLAAGWVADAENFRFASGQLTWEKSSGRGTGPTA